MTEQELREVASNWRTASPTDVRNMASELVDLRAMIAWLEAWEELRNRVDGK